jgi:tetratricopeptide (TPR) repeat protein
LKTKCALSIIVVLAGNVVPAHGLHVFNDVTTGRFIGQGNQYLDKRDYEKARQYYDAAIAHEPTAWGPYINRAVVYINQRKWDLAIQDLNTVIRLKPGHLIAALIRGGINEQLGNYSRALDDYDRVAGITASQLPLTCAWALNARAWLRATCPNGSFRNGKQAVADAKIACTTTACGSGCIDTLAAAYAEIGDFDSAIRFEQRAISRADQDESIRLVKDPERRRRATEAQLTAYHRHLAAYERRQPWRSNLH